VALISKDILDTIDKNIRSLIVEINKLPFVKRTWFSCGGNPEERASSPYIDIEYNMKPEYFNIIQKFNKKILNMHESVGKEIIIKRRYHYSFDWKTQRDIDRIWKEFMAIVEEFKRIKE